MKAAIADANATTDVTADATATADVNASATNKTWISKRKMAGAVAVAAP